MTNGEYMDFATSDLTPEERSLFMHYLAGSASVHTPENDWREMIDRARQYIERLRAERTSTQLPDSTIVKTDKPV